MHFLEEDDCVFGFGAELLGDVVDLGFRAFFDKAGVEVDVPAEDADSGVVGEGFGSAGCEGCGGTRAGTRGRKVSIGDGYPVGGSSGVGVEGFFDVSGLWRRWRWYSKGADVGDVGGIGWLLLIGGVGKGIH